MQKNLNAYFFLTTLRDPPKHKVKRGIEMIKKFRYKLVKKAEPGRMKNGANGNYELYDVYFGHNIILCNFPACDWTAMRDDYIYDGRHQRSCDEYCIEQGQLYKKYTDASGTGVSYAIVTTYKYKKGDWLFVSQEEIDRREAHTIWK